METVLTPELIAAFNECLENNDPKTFGQLARMEIVFGKLYQEDKGEELGIVLEYIKNRFPDDFFRASIDEFSEFLIQKKASQEDYWLDERNINSVCQDLIEQEKLGPKIEHLILFSKIVDSGKFPVRNEEIELDIDLEIHLLKWVAITIFLTRLGLISKQVWQETIKWRYFKKTVIQQDGKGRNLFNDTDEFYLFLAVLIARNGGRLPIVNNFWLIFLLE